MSPEPYCCRRVINVHVARRWRGTVRVRGVFRSRGTRYRQCSTQTKPPESDAYGSPTLSAQLHQSRQLSLVARSTPIEVLYYRTLTLPRPGCAALISLSDRLARLHHTSPPQRALDASLLSCNPHGAPVLTYFAPHSRLQTSSSLPQSSLWPHFRYLPSRGRTSG